MGWVETKRWQDFRNPGSQGDGSFFGITDGFKGQGNGYPGQCVSAAYIHPPNRIWQNVFLASSAIWQ